jgi:hypothetical protein
MYCNPTGAQPLRGAGHARKADGGASESTSTDEQKDEVAGEDILDHLNSPVRVVFR